MSRHSTLRAVPDLTAVTSPDPDAASTLEVVELFEQAAALIASRGAVRLEVGVADQDGQPLPFDVDFSAAPAFRVQATAVFPQHEVVGQTEPIDRGEYYAGVDANEQLWRLVAVTDLVEKLNGSNTLSARVIDGER